MMEILTQTRFNSERIEIKQPRSISEDILSVIKYLLYAISLLTKFSVPTSISNWNQTSGFEPKSSRIYIIYESFLKSYYFYN